VSNVFHAWPHTPDQRSSRPGSHPQRGQRIRRRPLPPPFAPASTSPFRSGRSGCRADGVRGCMSPRCPASGTSCRKRTGRRPCSRRLHRDSRGRSSTWTPRPAPCSGPHRRAGSRRPRGTASPPGSRSRRSSSRRAAPPCIHCRRLATGLHPGLRRPVRRRSPRPPSPAHRCRHRAVGSRHPHRRTGRGLRGRSRMHAWPDSTTGLSRARGPGSEIARRGPRRAASRGTGRLAAAAR